MEDDSPVRSPMSVLARSQFVNSVGDGAFYVTAALAFVMVVGLTPTQVAMGLTCAWSLGAVAAAPIGGLAERLGLRGSAAVLAAAVAVALGGLAAARSFGGFLLAVCCYAVAQSGLAGVRQALLVRVVPAAGRVRARAALQVALNAGLGVGAAAGGLALLSGRPAAYVTVLVGDAVAFLVAGALLLRLAPPAVPAAVPGTVRAAVTARRRVLPAVLADGRFVAATGLNAVLYLYMPVLSVLAPLWIAGRTAAPSWLVAGLFLVNTLGVMAAQRGVAGRVVDLLSAAGSVRRGGILLAAGCLALWGSAAPRQPVSAALVLLLAGALLTAGEVSLAAGSWEIGFALADPTRPGAAQGLYGSGVPAARAVGPAGLVPLVLTWSGPGWLVLGGAFAAAGLALAAVATSRATPTVPHELLTGGSR